MTQRIICGGGLRSGSTWQYNAVRSILRASGIASYGAWIDDYDPSRSEPIHVIKMHDRVGLDTFSQNVTLTSYRDLRAVATSMHRMGWLAVEDEVSLIGFLDKYIATLDEWRRLASHVMKYETMVADPKSELEILSTKLGWNLAPSQLAACMDDLTEHIKPPSANSPSYDKETLLHPAHISSAGQTLASDVQALIERRYGAWLQAHGYDIAR